MPDKLQVVSVHNLTTYVKITITGYFDTEENLKM